MKIPNQAKYVMGGTTLIMSLVFGANVAHAHCDTLDGPVVKAARAALAGTNVNLVLPWVRSEDEAEIKHAFENTLEVRKLSAPARDLADLYFFETLVRVHRAGEGAPYTGLKPAGNDSGPAIPTADKAIEDGTLDPVAKLLTGEVLDGLHERFKEVIARKNFRKDDVQAGRTYVKAYVEFVHYVEGVHSAASGETSEHIDGAVHVESHEHR